MKNKIIPLQIKDIKEEQALFLDECKKQLKKGGSFEETNNLLVMGFSSDDTSALLTWRVFGKEMTSIPFFLDKLKFDFCKTFEEKI